MPKITAPTVAEHHRRQRQALVDAATELLVTEGVRGVTPAAVGAAAGLARPSVYQYFRSGADILMAVIEEAFPPSIAALDDALRAVGDPRDVLEVYIRETLRQAAAGAHRVASALDGVPLSAAAHARLAELHHLQAMPFLRALQELRIEDLMITAQLLGGTVEAAMKAVEAGSDLAIVTSRTTAIVRAATGIA